MGSNSAYLYKGEAVHILRVSRTEQQRFTCRRCDRSMPEGEFPPIQHSSYTMRRGRTGNRYGGSDHKFVALHPWCRSCRTQVQGAWAKHPLYSPDLDRFMTKLFSSSRTQAMNRGIGYFLEKDDLLGLFIHQEGKCALTGLTMDFATAGSAGRGGKALLRPSLDRIDSRGNYAHGNVHVVAAAVNLMKGDLLPDQFVKLCRLVAEHDLVRQLEGL